jgi:cytidine deaminase
MSRALQPKESNMTPQDERELIESAIRARGLAYAPYSQFRVGAALLTKSGKVITGCNVENASYGLCICAERTAVCRAFSEGENEFVAIAIAATPLASPCGACRQFLYEFGAEIQVISVDADNRDRINRWTTDSLLPDGFRL